MQRCFLLLEAQSRRQNSVMSMKMATRLAPTATGSSMEDLSGTGLVWMDDEPCVVVSAASVETWPISLPVLKSEMSDDSGDRIHVMVKMAKVSEYVTGKRIRTCKTVETTHCCDSYSGSCLGFFETGRSPFLLKVKDEHCKVNVIDSMSNATS